jgi:hypothetical protein
MLNGSEKAQILNNLKAITGSLKSIDSTFKSLLKHFAQEPVAQEHVAGVIRRDGGKPTKRCPDAMGRPPGCKKGMCSTCKDPSPARKSRGSKKKGKHANPNA